MKILCVTAVILIYAIFEMNAEPGNGPRQEYLLNGYALRWPSAAERDKSLLTGHFVPHNIFQTKMQMWRNKAYVVQPRYKTGVPFTLGVMDLSGNDGNDEPVIKAYPDYESHRMQTPVSKRINNVIDVYLDHKGLLWALDNGDMDNGGVLIKKGGKTKVFAVDVHTDDIVTIIDLSSMMTAKESCPQSVAVDYNRNGELFIFVSDAGTHSIIVYNEAQDRFFKNEVPKRMNDSKVLDVLNMMMVRKPKEPNNLYFSYLKSEFIYHMETSAIDEAATSAVIVETGKKPFHMTFLGSDGGNVLFLRCEGSNNVYAWNTNDEFKKTNFIEAHRSTSCRIPLKVAPGFGDIMWLMESNLMDFATGTTSCVGPSTKLHPMVLPILRYERIH